MELIKIYKPFCTLFQQSSIQQFLLWVAELWRGKRLEGISEAQRTFLSIQLFQLLHKKATLILSQKLLNSVFDRLEGHLGHNEHDIVGNYWYVL